MSVTSLLMIVAAILLVLAAVGVPASRISLGWLGMFFWSLSIIIGGGMLH